MRVLYKPESPRDDYSYYRAQQGGALPYFSGSVSQRGDGLGSIFAGLARFVTRLPSWVKTGAKILGKQALRTGMTVARDMATDSETWKKDWKAAGKKHLKRAAGELLEEGGKELQSGSGLKRGKRRRKSIKGSVILKRKSSAKRKRKSVLFRKSIPKKERLVNQRTKQDIFEQ